MNPFPLNKDSEQKSNSVEKALSDVLTQEKDCLEQLNSLLAIENKMIAERNIKEMDHLLDQKLPLLSKLEQQDKQRQQIFAQHTGLSYEHTAFSVFIEQYPAQTIQQLWHSIKKLLTECKKQNELNGRIITVKKDNTEKLLQILLGKPANQTSSTYSNLGQTNLQKRSALYTSV